MNCEDVSMAKKHVTVVRSVVFNIFVVVVALQKIHPSSDYFTWAFSCSAGKRVKEGVRTISQLRFISQNRARAKAEAQEGELPCGYANTGQGIWCSLFHR